MYITFIGNCQSLALSFYFEQLLDPVKFNICWILYGESFRRCSYLTKCKNRIHDYDLSLERIKCSDIIIYQEINKNKSSFSNEDTLAELIKPTCTLVKIPFIYFHYNDFNNSLRELQRREILKNVDIKFSIIIDRYRLTNLMLTYNHPNTFFFMEMIKELCQRLNMEYFSIEQYSEIIKDDNYVCLPTDL